MFDENNYVLGIPTKDLKGIVEIEGGEIRAEEFPPSFRPDGISLYGQYFTPERVVISKRKITIRDRLRKYIEIPSCWKYRKDDIAD